MKICTIIAEFDPLHNGHLLLLQEARRVADGVVVLLSGNFTQRAFPAVADKYTRATHAVKGGADIVLELPTVFATGSAENFAFGGIALANAIQSDFLLFGSECGDLARLQKCADVLTEREKDNAEIKRQLKKGVSYPKAVGAAFPEFGDLLSRPNDLLALEYLKALHRSHSDTTPLTVRREDNYNSAQPTERYAGSRAIREMLRTGGAERFAPAYVLQELHDVTEEYKRYAAVCLATADKKRLAETEGVSEGLENRILRAACGDFDETIKNIKTKRYTQLKIQRIFLHYLLNITKETVVQAKARPLPINVLAAKRDTPLLSHVADCQKRYAGNNSAAEETTERADRLYAALTKKRTIRYLQTF